ISWNLNGIRAAIKKDFLKSLEVLQPDVLCVQETKAQEHQVIEALGELAGFHLHTYSAVRPGYSGTAMFCRTAPLSIQYGMDIEEHDQEGRVIAAEFPEYFVVTVYTPNSGEGLKRLEY